MWPCPGHEEVTTVPSNTINTTCRNHSDSMLTHIIDDYQPTTQARRIEVGHAEELRRVQQNEDDCDEAGSPDTKSSSTLATSAELTTMTAVLLWDLPRHVRPLISGVK